MPLSPPHLDDRRYDELFDGLRRRIPVYNPTWTDHNDSDPGITLLQLFAFMTESVLFRLNQVPEATQLTFLRLLDLPLRPATPARCTLAFTTVRATGEVVGGATVLTAGKLPFRLATGQDVPVWPVTALAVARTATAAPQANAEAQPGSADDPELFDVYTARLAELQGLLNLPEGGLGVATYTPTTLREGETGALSFASTVDQALWIALLNTTPGAPPDFGTAGAAEISLAFGLAAPAAGIADAVACGAGDAAASGDLLFELAEQDPATGAVSYQRLAIAGDTSAGLARSGTVRLTLPGTASKATWTPVPDVLDGTGDRPPPLAAEDSARLWLWLRLRRRAGRPPDLAMIATNAAEAVQARAVPAEFLGAGTGQPGQRFPLLQRPVIGGDPAMPVVIEVEEAGVWTRWGPTQSLDLARETDRLFALDAEAGEVRFGANGPPLGTRVRAAAYFQGGGAAGNVAPGAVNRIEGAAGTLTVKNITPGLGGAEAETLEEALTRIPGELRRRDRAVTAEDFRDLALLAPGAGIARAECLPRFHPRTKAWEQPGIVSVVIWPGTLPPDGAPPVPDRRSIDLVCRHLSARRLVTTELYVLPPDYVEIAVSVKVAVEPGYSVLAVTGWVEQILRQFLSPLPPHGPDGGGWPLGRAVNPRELEATVLQVQGVDFVEDLRLARRDGSGWTDADPVMLADEQAVWLSRVVAVGPGASLPPPGQDAPPPAGPPPMPIPVLREVC